MFEYNTVEEAVKDLQVGKLILVSDDESRENEGDLICAAEFATTENVNFMATYGKGLICMPMSGDLCRKLGLTQMVADNTDNHETAFTVSIDHVKTTTGISLLQEHVCQMKQSLRMSEDRDICFHFVQNPMEFLKETDIQRQQ